MAITPGTDTYVTVAEADAYFLARYGNDDWAALTETIKEQALVSAVQQLDLLCAWYGTISESDQALAFPRYPDSDPVPDDVKNAQCEIANNIITENSTSTDGGAPLTELKAGSVTLKFAKKQTMNPLTNSLILRMLAPFGSCSGTGQIPLKRG